MGIKRTYTLRTREEIGVVVDEALELTAVIKEHAPDAIKLGEIKNQFGRKVAIVSSQHGSKV
jgi:hypothetical protein